MIDEANTLAVLELAEKSGIENLRCRHKNADALNKESHSTLLLLLTAASAAGAYGFGVFDAAVQHPPQMWAAFAVSIYLAAVCGYQVFKAMRVKPFPAVYNEPENINYPKFAAAEIRQTQVELLQERITEACEFVDAKAKILNEVRVAAIAAPVVALLVAVGALFF